MLCYLKKDWMSFEKKKDWIINTLQSQVYGKSQIHMHRCGKKNLMPGNTRTYSPSKETSKQNSSFVHRVAVLVTDNLINNKNHVSTRGDNRGIHPWTQIWKRYSLVMRFSYIYIDG